MLAQWHFWTAFFGTGALLVLLAWLGSRRRKLSPKQIAAGGYPAACGSCGYNLTGLPGNICPECGSDLELVGRLSPHFYRWSAVPITARLIVWTIILACFTAGILAVSREAGVGRIQHFDATIQRGVNEPLVQGSEERPLMSYEALTLIVRARFVRPAPMDDWMEPGYGMVMPRENTRWIDGYIEVHRSTRPTVEGTGYHWPAGARLAGSGLVYIEPDGLGNPKISRLSLGNLAFEDDHVLLAAIKGALEQAGYAGEYGTAEELATPILPTVESFLRHGAPTVLEKRSAWYPEYGGLAATTARTVQAPTFRPLAAAGIGLLASIAWALGLPFILRKRPMSIRRELHTAPSRAR